VSNAARRPNRGLPVVVGCLEGGAQGQREGGTAEVEGQGYGKKCGWVQAGTEGCDGAWRVERLFDDACDL
jgi:hypothetical protein